MSKTDTKDLGNEFFDGILLAAFVGLIGFAGRKIFKEGFGAPQTLSGTLKLGAAMGIGQVGIHYFQEKEWIPNDPFGA